MITQSRPPRRLLPNGSITLALRGRTCPRRVHEHLAAVTLKGVWAFGITEIGSKCSTLGLYSRAFSHICSENLGGHEDMNCAHPCLKGFPMKCFLHGETKGKPPVLGVSQMETKPYSPSFHKSGGVNGRSFPQQKRAPLL